MAVYTPLTFEEVKEFFNTYSVGEVENFQPILSGIENSNFIVTTDQNIFILTLLEKRTASQSLPFIFEYMKLLSNSGIKVPVAQFNHQGLQASLLKGKPAIVTSFLPGRGIESEDLTEDLIYNVGKTLAHMHKVGQGVTQQWANPMSIATIEDLSSNLDHDFLPLIKEEILFQTSQDYSQLPRGPLHGDFFPDNIFINDHQKICGVIDFYYACWDVYIYDMALALNAFCFEGGGYKKPFADAFLHGYQSMRPLEGREIECFSSVCRWAALRILTTRVYDFVHQKKDDFVVAKNPNTYKDILEFHQRERILAR